MADDGDFGAWLTQVRTHARANGQPIAYYHTKWGVARLERDPSDPTQAYFVGDEIGHGPGTGEDWTEFRHPIDDDPNAMPVRASPPHRPMPRERYTADDPENQMQAETLNRNWAQRFQDAARDADMETGSFYEPIGQFFRGPNLADDLNPESTENAAARARAGQSIQSADDRRAYIMLRQGFYRDWREQQEVANELDPAKDFGDWSADLTGGLVGSLKDPLNYIGPGRNWLMRAIWQGGIQGAQNVEVQSREIAAGVRRAETPADRLRLGRELDQIREKYGDAAMLAALDTYSEQHAHDEDRPAPYDVLETAFAAGGGAVFSAGMEGTHYVVGRALRGIGGALVRHATRLRLKSLGDPALDALARDADGAIDPNAVPLGDAFANTDPWLRELGPVVQRAATATDPNERAAAYADAAIRLLEAQDNGADVGEFIHALEQARAKGNLPPLRALDVLADLGHAVRDGHLATHDLADAARELGELTSRIDPQLRVLNRNEAVLRERLNDADSKLTEQRIAEAAARANTPRGETSTDTFSGHESEWHPQPEDVDEAALDIEAAQRAQRERPETLSTWVRNQGGISDDRGDMRAAGDRGFGLSALIAKDGVPADDLALGAWEAGFFPDHAERPSVRDFVDAVTRDLSDRDVVRAADMDAHAAAENAGDVLKFYEREGVDTSLRGKALRTALHEQVTARAAPQGWGARHGQAAGMGAGGAAVSPQVKMNQYLTPVPRQTFLARQARAIRRRGVTTYVSDVIARAYTSIIEGQHPLVMAQQQLIKQIEQLSGGRPDVKPSENAAMLARLSRDGYSPGHLDLMHGVRRYRQPDVKASPAFREAIETALDGKEWVEERISAFENYLIARRAVKAWDRYSAGELPRPPHPMSRSELATAIRAFEMDNPKFRDGADLLYKFLEAHWEKKRDAGFITQEQYDAGLANNEDYVPFQRDMDDSGANPSRGAEKGQGAGDRKNKAAALKRFRGSDRKILSPLSTIMADVYATADRIARNETYRAFVDLAQRAGPLGEDIVKSAPASMQKTRIDIADEAERAARAAGASPQDAQALAGSIDSLLNGDTARTIYRAGDVIEGGRKIIYVWRDGKREAYELTDPEWSDDLFKAMTGLTQESRDLFLDIVSTPTQAIRTAITAWPGFQMANIVRDSLSAWMLTDLGYKPGEALTHGIGQVLKQGDLAKLYNAVGTQGGGVVRSALPKARLERDLPSLRGKILRTRNLDPRHGASMLWHGFEQATELSENATRIRLFARGFERGKKQGLSDYDSAVWAAYESRDYLDFQRTGSKMLNARRVVLFLNAALQGLDRTFRTLSAEGDGKLLMEPLTDVFAGRKAMANLTPDERYKVSRAYKYWVKLALVGTFGLGLTALNADDPDYQYGFSDYTKNNYWLVRTGKYWLAIPKPFEHAVVSNILERAYEGTAGRDPLAWQRLVNGLGQTYMPPTEVTAAQLPIELWANRTATGAPIVPEGMEDLDPHLQYTAFTSRVAVNLAQGLSTYAGIEVSPAQLDHVVNGTVGEFYRTPARMLGQADPSTPALNLTEFPVISRFIREPGVGGTPTRVAFNETVMRTSGTLNRAAGTLSELADRGDSAGAERFLATRPGFERDYAVLVAGFPTDARRLHPMLRARSVVTSIGRIKRELSGGRPLNSETLILPGLSPRERRDAIEALDDLQAAEMQAALVMSGAPGFQRRQMVDVPSRYERLRIVSPATYALLRARLVSGANKAIDFGTVRRLWPEAQRRIQGAGFRADLSDLAAEGRADFGDAALRQLELESRGGVSRSARQRRQQRQDFQQGLGQ